MLCQHPVEDFLALGGRGLVLLRRTIRITPPAHLPVQTWGPPIVIGAVISCGKGRRRESIVAGSSLNDVCKILECFTPFPWSITLLQPSLQSFISMSTFWETHLSTKCGCHIGISPSLLPHARQPTSSRSLTHVSTLSHYACGSLSPFSRGEMSLPLS